MWMAVAVTVLALQSPGPTESEYDRAVEAARAGQFEEARAIFHDLREEDPSDIRPHVELAGIAFRLGDYGAARTHLSDARRIDPGDGYATNLLATIYLLDDNIEAALKYWNLLGEPRIASVRADPPVDIDPVLWDRAFAFSPASTLMLGDFRDTRVRLESLDLFAGMRFDLVPTGAEMDLEFRSAPLGGGIGRSYWATVASLAQGLPYETMQLNFRNLASRGVNLHTLVRWDEKKRRAQVRVTAPLADPGRRFELTIDGRDESWVAGPEEFSVRKLKASAAFRSEMTDRWKWHFGVNASQRNSGKQGDRNGFLATFQAGATRRLFALPEYRLRSDLSGTTEFARDYFKGEGEIALQWRAGDSGAYETTSRLRFGHVAGAVPFDELFDLGLDRDHDRMLRGHAGRSDGRKGGGAITAGFLLWNVDVLRRVVTEPFVAVRVGPFMDVAYVTSDSSLVVDAGIRAELALGNGLRLDFSFGTDLLDGKSAVFYRSAWK